MVLCSFQVLLYITALTAVYLSPVINAATLAEASFNDPRCEDGGVCPTDPLLFTCNVTNTSSDRVFLTFSFAEMDLLSLTNNNVTQGAQPDGINIQSHNVTGVGPYDYILTLSIANASLLNGGMIECDSIVGVTDVAKCPVAGDPDPPLNLTHDMSANTVSSAVIRWDPPSTTGGDGISITGYRIMSSDNGLNLNETVGDMNYNITGLQYNTDYSVEVTAINSCGQESGPASVVVNIEARAPPPPSLLSPELYCDVPLEDGRPVIIKWMSGTKVSGVVYPGAVDVSVVLNPGDIACSGVNAEDTSCVINITEDGVYSVTITLTNDVSSTQHIMVFNSSALKLEGVNATSIKVKLNPFCHPNTTYTVQVFFGVRQEGGNDTCPPEQSFIATIVPSESVILSVTTTALMLEDDQEYCSTNASLTEPPTDVDDGNDSDDGGDSTSDGLSTGAAVGLAVALTLLVALPVGVVLGWCIWRRGRGCSGKGTQQKVQGAIYEEPVPGPVDAAIPLTDNQAYGLVKKN